MFRTHQDNSSHVSELNASYLPPELAVNAIDGADRFVSNEPTPKPESRRGWRRRRIRRGKS